MAYDKVSDSDSEKKNWDLDPEIEVQDVKDGRNTTFGKVVRKATEPLPVCAPMKAKVSFAVSVPQRNLKVRSARMALAQ